MLTKKKKTKIRRLGVKRASRRRKGWVKYRDRVVVIDITKGVVKAICGRICSSSPLPGNADGDYSGVDNIKRTVVGGDEMFNPLADSGTDAYEKSFAVKDPMLLKMWEARRLKDPKRAVDFFRGHLNPITARDVSRVLRETKLK